MEREIYIWLKIDKDETKCAVLLIIIIICHTCAKEFFKFELKLSSYWQNIKFSRYCPKFHIFTNIVIYQVFLQLFRPTASSLQISWQGHVRNTLFHFCQLPPVNTVNIQMIMWYKHVFFFFFFFFFAIYSMYPRILVLNILRFMQQCLIRKLGYLLAAPLHLTLPFPLT